MAQAVGMLIGIFSSGPPTTADAQSSDSTASSDRGSCDAKGGATAEHAAGCHESDCLGDAEKANEEGETGASSKEQQVKESSCIHLTDEEDTGDTEDITCRSETLCEGDEPDCKGDTCSTESRPRTSSFEERKISQEKLRKSSVQQDDEVRALVKSPSSQSRCSSSDGDSGGSSSSTRSRTAMGMLLGMFSSQPSEPVSDDGASASSEKEKEASVSSEGPPSPQLQELRQAVERAEAAGASCELLEHVKSKLEELETEIARDVKVHVRHAVSGELAAVVRVRACDTASRLREAVLRCDEFASEGEEGLSSVHFLFGEQMLADHMTLSEAGIRDGDSVALVRSPLRCLSASFDGTVRLWHLQEKDSEGCTRCSCFPHESAAADSGPVLSAALAPGGSVLLTVASGGEGKLWCAETGNAVAGLEGAAATGEFSPGGCRVVGASNDDLARIWCAETGRCLQALQGHTGEVRAACFSPDGGFAMTGAGDGTAALWDASTGQCMAVLEGHVDDVRSVAFSADMLMAATASSDCTARVWAVPSGKCLQTFRGHEKALSSVSFSPDGSRLLTAAFDGTARIWDTATGECTLVVLGDNNVVNHAAFSPDCEKVLVASASECLRLFNVQTGECLLSMFGHEDWVRSASFSPDGMVIASASYDGTARLWSGVTGECLKVLEGHNGAVISVAFVEA
mmetsp:Transcript_66065/g.118961  ORF Transcript_66065/g.118961 Transcript_66065/m.118961 type:complete len:685 (-) Transcript_66065:120-2174(-)